MEAASRKIEEGVYAKVAGEISEGIKSDGLWAMAIAHSAGQPDLAKSLYIQYRAQSIVDEMELKIARDLQASRQAEVDAKAKEKLAIEKRVHELSTPIGRDTVLPKWVFYAFVAAIVFVGVQLYKHYS
ncbi:hypothetical protein DelCs14_2667 [Delftia sp. Cs1-4]|uniref:hypothetical protein n=1 Tax=Delftia sp. (strain Cs1-4) TaxID=742013 RepID=UPI00020E8279|nr:hypothetical protein [Delftia sp. Cs1-4]AEF89679.1 hypothetical protein DelCs14_2667 [Delftia sp. Cs1-4]